MVQVLPGCLPAGEDPNLGAKRGRGSTRGERHQRDATGVTSSVSGSVPMVFTVQALLSLRPEPSIPTAMASKRHRRGKRREREAPASKHQIRPGNGCRAGRRGSGMPNPPRENNISGANGDSPRGRGALPIFTFEKITLRRKLKARKKQRRVRPCLLYTSPSPRDA